MSTWEDKRTEALLSDPGLRPVGRRSWSEVAEEWSEWNMSASWYDAMAASQSKGLRGKNLSLQIDIQRLGNVCDELEYELERSREVAEALEAALVEELESR